MRLGSKTDAGLSVMIYMHSVHPSRELGSAFGSRVVAKREEAAATAILMLLLMLYMATD